jgi:hypothetical protein
MEMVPIRHADIMQAASKPSMRPLAKDIVPMQVLLPAVQMILNNSLSAPGLKQFG